MSAANIRVRRLLKQTHLSTRQFCRETGFPFRTLDNYVRDISEEMHAGTAERLARRFSEKLRRFVDPRWLAGE